MNRSNDAKIANGNWADEGVDPDANLHIPGDMSLSCQPHILGAGQNSAFQCRDRKGLSKNKFSERCAAPAKCGEEGKRA